VAHFLIVVFLAFWYIFQPDGLTPAQQIMHNVLGVECVCLLMLAQYMFEEAVILLIVAVGALGVQTVCLGILEMRSLRRRVKRSRRLRAAPVRRIAANALRRVLREMKPYVLMTLFLVFLWPSWVLLSDFGVGKAVIASNYRQFVHEQVAHGEDVRDAYADKLALLGNAAWAGLDVQARLNVLQAVVCVEAEYLCIPVPEVVGMKMDRQSILGQYDEQKKRIIVNLDTLAESDPEACVETVAHECRHAYQHAVVDVLDWSDERVQKMEAFYWIRRWKYEQDHYVSGGANYRAYYGQEIEADARMYSFDRLGVYSRYLNQ